jgi:hypothetical protein
MLRGGEIMATDGLAAWRLEGPLTPADRTRIVNHPVFARAAYRLAENMLSLRHHSRALNGMFKDAGHYVAAMMAIHLHASGGLTMKRLRDFCASSGYLSPGRARALLIYMQYLRYVDILPIRRDQMAQYMPTQQFIEAWRLHLRLALEAAALIEPGIHRLLARFDDNRLFDAFAGFHCQALIAAVTDDTNRALTLERIFLHRLGGHYVLHALILGGVDRAPIEHSAFPPSLPNRLSVAALSRAFGVSRLHISRVLDDAEAAGLLARLGDGSLHFREEAREELVTNYASQLVCLLAAAAAAMALSPVDEMKEAAA